MSNQSDYGTSSSEEIALVPNTLRAYRHFVLSEGQLSPVSSSLGIDGNPYRLDPPAPDPVSPYVTPKYLDVSCPCVMCRQPKPVRASDGVFTADCRRFAYAALGIMPTQEIQLALNDVHSAPNRKCRCGFYAHYDPQEDFYAGTYWYWQDKYLWQNAALVKAVVELSGRVVMGTKGVRAERMKIVAISADWDKYRRHPNDRVVDWSGNWSIYPDWSLHSAYTSERKPSSSTEDEVNQMVRDTALRYGSRYFYTPSSMYHCYPKQDVSALLESSDET